MSTLDSIKEQQKFAERMARETAHSNMNKMWNDTQAAKVSGQLDSFGKVSSAMNSAVKSIQF